MAKTSPPQPPIDKEVILLGLLAEAPQHAYALEEKIRERRMTEWTDIAFSSVYRVVSRLAAQGLVDTHLEQAGQGSTRKVHAINDAGKAALRDGVLHYLGSLVPAKTPFHVALAFLTEAPLKSVRVKLAERATAVAAVQAQLAANRRHIVKALDAAPAGGVTESHRLRLRLLFDHIEYHTRAERAFIKHAQALLAQAKPSTFRAPAGATKRRAR